MTLKKTPLHAQHLKLQAKMSPFADYEMPLEYSSSKNEALCVRKNCGIFDVSHMGEFLVSGSEAQNFVDYLLPNDFLKIKEKSALYSPLCNREGKILDDLIAYKLKQDLVLICLNASNIEKDWKWISQIHQEKGFACQIEDISSKYCLIALQGPNSYQILEKLFGAKEQYQSFSVYEQNFSDNQVWIAHTGYTGEKGVEIFCPNQVANQLWTTLLDMGAIPCGLIARDVLRIEAGFPLYGQELNEQRTPLDSGLSWTVAKKENDFVGKKALETYIPCHKPIRLSVEKGIPRKDYCIFNENEEKLGVVTSGTYSVVLEKGICLGLLNLSPYKSLYVEIRGNLIKAQVHKKNFLV